MVVPISSMKDNAERGADTKKKNYEKNKQILEGTKERVTRSVVKEQNNKQSIVVIRLLVVFRV